ncbi:alpha-keto acid decarboxylase family protein [Psychrobacter lutiphocae]|uniref:alpha-keto acid decarboxylase family protein n=1 Tax=Psychrobacter lutiphocae TaxID=540500 RepID=UPI000373AD3C|nr:thiamine pyrophosphate-binding protein [Psychrobacter lutiphocae]
MTIENYTIADYLFDRIAEAGATEVFGVPGDYNLLFLDNILASDKLRWVGNTNELNAGYAADGYARERGFAAMVTTFGVGELSAINATAGSYAEYAPVLHITGAPKMKLQDKKLVLHHSLGNGIFDNFAKMAESVSVAQAIITPENAASQIDYVITQIVKKQRPGYISLPADVAQMPIYPPSKKLDLQRDNHTSQQALDEFKQALIQFIDGKETMLLADIMVKYLGLKNALNELIEDTSIPYATLSWGKSLLNEQSERWAGVYYASVSDPVVKDAVENSECLIMVGVTFTDTTSSGFSQEIEASRTINISEEESSIGDKVFAPISMKDALQVLHEVLTSGIKVVPKPLQGSIETYQQQADDDDALLQQDLWHIVADNLTENSLVFAEQGTSYNGMGPIPLPKGVTFHGQPLWGSIGYTLPASLGAGIASADKRSILLIGDGSSLLTIQDIAIMLREKLNPVILLINNSGYTIERAIHGEEEIYNDIPNIDWQLIPKAFGATDDNCLILKAKTAGELKSAIAQAKETTDKMVFIEVFTGVMDIPPVLAKQAALF